MAQGQLSRQNPLWGSALTKDPQAVSSIVGTILRINAETGTCDVATTDRRWLCNLALPGLSSDPEGPGGTITVPRLNQPVLVDLSTGWPTITKIFPVPTNTTANDQPSFSVADTADNPTSLLYGQESAPNYRARLPKLLPGDTVTMGNQGQAVYVLDQGVCGLRASPLAKVEVNQCGDTTQIVGRNLSLMSGFGSVEFVDSGGKHSFEFKGGVDQLTQTGKDNWIVRSRVGGDAVGLLDLQVSNTQGDKVYSFSCGMEGSVAQTQAGNLTQQVSGTSSYRLGGSRNAQIDNGDDVLLMMNGSQRSEIWGNRVSDILDGCFTNVGSVRRDQVRGDWSMAVGRNMSINVSGDPLPSTPIDASLRVVATNGSVLFDVGNPLAGDLAKTLSGFKVNTHGVGNIELLAKELGLVMIDSTLPAASVWVGANTLSPKFEPAVLGFKLISLLTQMMAMFDTHVHMIVVPVPGVPTMIPMAPMTPVVAANLPFLISKKVMLGL